MLFVLQFSYNNLLDVKTILFYIIFYFPLESLVDDYFKKM